MAMVNVLGYHGLDRQWCRRKLTDYRTLRLPRGRATYRGTFAELKVDLSWVHSSYAVAGTATPLSSIPSSQSASAVAAVPVDDDSIHNAKPHTALTLC